MFDRDGDRLVDARRRGELREALSQARVTAEVIKVRVNDLLAENAGLRFRVLELEAGVRDHRAAVSADVAERMSPGASDRVLWALVEDGE
jgi:hypothetical protein